MRRSGLLWPEGTEVHKKGEKKMGELRGSGWKRGPAPHHSEKHHYRSALAAACVPCRQAEQKGGGERKRLTAGLLCCHSDCLCIESIERRFLGSGTLPVFFLSSSFLTVPLFLPAGFKPLCGLCVKCSIKCVKGHLPKYHGCGCISEA